MEVVIPGRSNRRVTIEHDQAPDNQWRYPYPIRPAPASFLGHVHIAIARCWINLFDGA
jgi:hypothetical protein